MSRNDDTSMGGARGELPETRLSAIQTILAGEPLGRAQAMEALVAGYWKPVYKSIRIRWSKQNEDAKDLTQEFFSRIIEKDTLRGFDPAKGRFRTFLMVCLQRFLSNEHEAAHRLKRGGGVVHQSLDFEGAEGELRAAPAAAAADSLETYFEREWVRHLFGLALDALRAECAERGKEAHFRLFERWDLGEGLNEPTSYEEMEREFGLTRNQVGNVLADCRRRLRRLILDRLRSITSSEEEFRAEARAVLGSEAV